MEVQPPRRHTSGSFELGLGRNRRFPFAPRFAALLKRQRDDFQSNADAALAMMGASSLIAYQKAVSKPAIHPHPVLATFFGNAASAKSAQWGGHLSSPLSGIRNAAIRQSS
ncbi:MAG: hypothetical protein ACKN9T_10385 [Candidatus Methylumidiphilus sp.]